MSQPPVNDDVEQDQQNDEHQMDTNNARIEPPPRYRYELERTFDTKQECLDFIKSENCWTRVKEIKQSCGFKTIHRCNFCKSRGQACSANIYTIHGTSPEDHTYKLYRRVAEHDHEGSTNAVSVLSDEAKGYIKQYVIEGLTLKKILFRLRDMKIVQPEKTQVESFIKKCRKEIFGDSKVTVEDMVTFCEQNSETPEDIDQAFVLAYEHSPLEVSDDLDAVETDFVDDEADSETEETEEQAPKGPWIRFFVTTKRLLANSSNSDIVHADATHKVVIQRYPILNFGTTDKDNVQHFHLLGIMVSKHECTADYEFAFKAIRDGILRVTGKPFKPTVLMADAAAQIGNGFKAVYGDDVKILMCYAHVMMAVDRKKFANKDNKNRVKDDLRQLRFAHNTQTFNIGCELFLKKWKTHEPEFTKYFEKYWIKRNQNWYRGAYYRVPATNNAVESFNANLKAHQTFWQKKGLAEFKVRLLNIVAQRSKEYMKDKAEYRSEVNMTKNMHKDGLAYSKIKNVVFRKSESEGKLHCFMLKGDSKNVLTEEDVNTFLAATHDSFDEFTKNQFNIYQMTFNEDPSVWQNSDCTCPAFSAYFICKHVLCIAYKLKLLVEKKGQPLGSNAKPGRPKNATKGMLKD